MKKFFVSVFSLISLVFITVCTEETVTNNSNLTAGTYFSDYETFTTNRSAWTEPDSYKFNYDFRFGDSVVILGISVQVENGTAIFDYGNETEESIEELKSFSWGNIAFENISQMYDYLENRYKQKLANGNTDYRIEYSVTYKSDENYGNYPVIISENMTDIKHPDIVGYGGVYIKLNSFSITDTE
ncbi:hypothetical protein [Treponema sp.]|uniref:hypothetical protein n=1 Tax=Treponema sp. TaxID=166 RepID=UPI003890C87E